MTVKFYSFPNELLNKRIQIWGIPVNTNNKRFIIQDGIVAKVEDNRYLHFNNSETVFDEWSFGRCIGIKIV